MITVAEKTAWLKQRFLTDYSAIVVRALFSHMIGQQESVLVIRARNLTQELPAETCLLSCASKAS